ncbi:MAG: RNB domain-containing ribonuclease [Treponema sp.]|jgi:exoribonuclease-2|nr:RNB domain-containing ribonuclease [Treponema sp.]
MITENALVVYKNKPALVKEVTDGKFSISLQDGAQIKVRDKDIELIHPGPVKTFSAVELFRPETSVIREAWELLSDEGSPLSLKDFSVFIFNEYTPSSAYAAYTVLQDGLFFYGAVNEIIPHSREIIEAEEAKRGEKQREADERTDFLNRVKTCLKKPGENLFLPADTRFIQDIEALAYGKTAKSRTMKELDLGETPEEAHSLLLKTGFWTAAVNPHPSRFGLSLNKVDICPEPAPEEERCDLCHLAAFAIDSPWSNDPDDAVSVQGNVIFVHVADPASSVILDSLAEKEARNRGVTLYLPETTVRMLADDALPMFALGLNEKSLALTFKMTLDGEGRITETEIFPSIVKVRRMTYEEADKEMDEADTPDANALRALNEKALCYFKRRIEQGAADIELPDVHITVKDGVPEILPVVHHRSSVMVRECMIIAGEGAGNWAARNSVVFPYLSQEADILPDTPPGGFAGSWQTRRCMKPRILSVKPSRHQGLGLDIYTQVTSPLRRYTDLLAHIQIRSFLRGSALLDTDEVLTRLGYSEAAASAAVHAERASVNHWIMVYLADKINSVWEAVTLEKKGNRWVVIIPLLALEIQVPLQNDVTPNDTVSLILKSVNIPRGEAVFVQVTSK